MKRDKHSRMFHSGINRCDAIGPRFDALPPAAPNRIALSLLNSFSLHPHVGKYPKNPFQSNLFSEGGVCFTARLVCQWALPCEIPQGAQVVAESIMQCATKLAGAKARPVSEYLLAKGDAYVGKQIERWTETRDKDMDSKDPGVLWRKELLDLCRQTAGMSYGNLALPADMAAARGIKCLCPREQLGLAYWMQKDPSLFALDVRPSIGRMIKMHDGCLNTVLPDSRVVLVHQKRMMCGLEAMMLQGFPAGPLKKHAAKHGPGADRLYSDMAGNAFSAPVVAAVLIGCILNLTEAHLALFGKAGEAHAGSEQSGGADNDEYDDDYDILSIVQGIALG